MTGLIFWDAIKAMSSLPDFWFGIVAWALVIWGVNALDRHSRG